MKFDYILEKIPTAFPNPIPAKELAIIMYVRASSSSGLKIDRRKYFLTI